MGLTEEHRIARSIEKIETCTKLLTEILNDNRETINFIFKDINKKLKEEKYKKELAKDRPPEGGVKKFWETYRS